MCPVPQSVPTVISIDSTDEDLVRFIEGMEAGDPAPGNVITDVDPFSVEPWNFPEVFWFLHNPEGSRLPKMGYETKVTKSGYWRLTDDRKILTGDCTLVRKSLLEFYKGKSPFGERTGWRMHEYVVQQHIFNGCNYSKDYSSLYRIFLQNDRTSQGEQTSSSGAGDSVGEDVEYMLLSLLEQEERNLSSKNSSKNSQIVSEKDQEQSALFKRRPDESVTENSAENIYEVSDFFDEGYLELNDLYSPDTPASPDNSRLISVNSDEEYFDPVALFSEIGNGHVIGVKEESTDYRFNIYSPAKSNQVLIRLPPSGSIDKSDLAIEESTTSSLVRSELHNH